MQAYSNDLRQRVVAAVERAEHSFREIARLFFVDLSTVVRWLQRHRKTGSVQPKPHGGAPRRKLDAAAEARLLDLVRDQPDATLAELRDRLGVPCHIMTIARALKRHDITRKKRTLHAQEQDSPRVRAQRKRFRRKMAHIDVNRLIFVDEAGANTAMSRTHGRAPRGERVRATVPGAWKNVTLIAGLRLSGVVAPMALAGAMDLPAFQTYVHQAMVPQLRKGDVVVWDNLRIHKSPALVAAVQAAGAEVEPLPVYSPDLSPIEEMYSKVKGHLRSAAARTTSAVIGAMGKALDLVTRANILGWFRDRCPYALRK